MNISMVEAAQLMLNDVRKFHPEMGDGSDVESVRLDKDRLEAVITLENGSVIRASGLNYKELLDLELRDRAGVSLLGSCPRGRRFESSSR